MNTRRTQATANSLSPEFAKKKEVINMPNKNGTGPKGQGPKDCHGKGKGKGNNPGQGPMTGGKKGVKEKTEKENKS